MITARTGHSAPGYSLVEMLLGIAVLAVIGVLALPNSILRNREAGDLQNQRNAEQLAAVATAARDAGYDFVAGSTDVAEVVERVRTGHTLSASENPELVGTYFGLPALGESDRRGATKFLQIVASRLVYDANPISSTEVGDVSGQNSH